MGVLVPFAGSSIGGAPVIFIIAARGAAVGASVGANEYVSKMDFGSCCNTLLPIAWKVRSANDWVGAGVPLHCCLAQSSQGFPSRI